MVRNVRGSFDAKDKVGTLVTGSQGSNATLQFDTPGSALVFDGPFLAYAAHHLQSDAKLTETPAASNVSFYVKTGMVVIAAFALMFLYTQWQDVIAERTGLRLTHVCCIIYASLSISIDLSIKNAAEAYAS